MPSRYFPSTLRAWLLWLFVVSIAPAIPAYGQTAVDTHVSNWTARYGKSPAHFTPADWAPIIDATWGEGLPTADKLALFDTWWNEIDQRYGAFHNSEVDIDTLRDHYRPQIEAGISKGRFSGIMNHFTYRLEELHTYLYDIPVRNTPMTKGVPMMVIGQWGTNARFGALLTPLPDSTLLVYEALPTHPIGLEAGDVVLGYDGVLWKDIYPELLEAELPLFLNPVNASTPESSYFYAMQAAGLNWHLFDTIDIVKYPSGDTLHFDTNLLAGENRTLWGKEQIPPPGVNWPNRSLGNRVGWGIISDSNIGFVTVTSWSFDAQFDIRAKFESAVDELMNTPGIDGIIFDFRFNTGGGALAREGLTLLFNEAVSTVGFDQRIPGSEDPLAMEPDPQRREINLVIRGQSSSFFDKPIAILIGPGSISAGELEARRMSFHPNARIFGLPAPGGNTGSDFISIGDPNWFVSRAHSTQYLVDGHQYLSHLGLEPDERVWFTQEDAANRVDTVIKAAMDWIESGPTSRESSDGPVKQLYASASPNPFSSSATLNYELPFASQVNIEIYDLLGRRLLRFTQGLQPIGRHRFLWDGDDNSGVNMPSGIYFWRISAGDRSISGRLVKVR